MNRDSSDLYKCSLCAAAAGITAGPAENYLTFALEVFFAIRLFEHMLLLFNWKVSKF